MFKKLLFIIGLIFTCGFLKAQQFPPKPNTLVADFTNTLSGDNKQQLENKLVAFNDSTSTQVAVVIIKSVGDYDINEYGTFLGRNWGIGQKDKNNGILLLVALNDRKVSIQTGYGAEGSLPDAITNRIIEEDIKPNFRNKDYYAGLDKATDDIIKYTKGEYKADPNQKKGRQKSGGGAGIIIFIVVIVLILIFRNRGGGGGHIIGGRGGASPFWWFLAGNMLGNSGRGGGDWGGFSGGGGSSGGGGGGFGGFGGGSFGGGGSSGSW